MRLPSHPFLHTLSRSLRLANTFPQSVIAPKHHSRNRAGFPSIPGKMAELAGLAASIITLVEVSIVVISISNEYQDSARSAANEVNRLTGGVENLKTTLEEVSILLNQENPLDGLFKAMQNIIRSNNTLQSCLAAL